MSNWKNTENIFQTKKTKTYFFEAKHFSYGQHIEFVTGRGTKCLTARDRPGDWKTGA